MPGIPEHSISVIQSSCPACLALRILVCSNARRASNGRSRRVVGQFRFSAAEASSYAFSPSLHMRSSNYVQMVPGHIVNVCLSNQQPDPVCAQRFTLLRAEKSRGQGIKPRGIVLRRPTIYLLEIEPAKSFRDAPSKS